MDLLESPTISHLDEILKFQILELKNQIEENELVFGIRSGANSSLYIPKDPEFYTKERKLELKRLLCMPTDTSMKVIADSIRSELDSCDKFEYNDKSLPFIINQYFIRRTQRLAIMKHSLMLRLKRYCVTEELKKYIQHEYDERIKTIDNEYNDLVIRTNRLQVITEAYVCNTDQGQDEVTAEDMIIYLKSLTLHLYSIRYMSQMIKVLQWIPMKFRKKNNDIVSVDTQSLVKSEKSVKMELASEGSFKSEHSKVLSARPTSIIQPMPSIAESYPAVGGGLSIDERNLNMPLHTNSIRNFDHILKNLCYVYSIDMDIKTVKTSADEMELYSHVSRKFKATFAIQEQMRTFKVYDRADGGADRWGIDSSQHALLKPATWMSFSPFKAKINLAVSKYQNHLKSQNLLDGFLKTSSTFMKKSYCEDTQNCLRHHALIIQHLPVVHNTSVVANPKGFSISDIFKLIYNKLDFNLKTFSSEENNGESNAVDHDTYKFKETLQMLGLDDCVETKDDPSSVQGAYLSYLSLRFLKIRDLQRTCLSILNYFRSIERTLVLNTHGYSKRENLYQKSQSRHDEGSSNQNLGNHDYLSDHIDNFKVSDHEFMKYADVVNHDDFYFHDEGRVHVKDQMNYWIIYDIAVKDFEEMEENLILIGSYYITMDKDYRMTSLFNRKKSQAESDENSAFITQYGHREVDRFGVIYDLWNQQTGFMQSKKALVDLYMEVYNSICKREDRQIIAQIIVDIIYQKPRLDLTLNYFIPSYHLESRILKLEMQIMKTILEKEKDRLRNFMKTEYKDIDDGYQFVEKLLIHPNSDESVLKPLYLLEFVTSLGMIGQVKKSLDFACSLIKTHFDTLSVEKELKMETEFLSMIEEEFRGINVFSGKFYKADMLNSLMSASIFDNPNSMLKIGEQYIKNIESRNTRGDKRSKKMKLINEFGRLLDLISVRFRLIDALWTTEYLSSIYNTQAFNLGYDNYHIYMRLIPFESAKRKELLENYKPLLYVSSVQDEDTMVDKFQQDEGILAIHELDTVHMGKLVFSKPSKIIDLLQSKGLEDLQLTLKMQLCHMSSLEVAILLCDLCRPSIYTMQDCDEEIDEMLSSRKSSSYSLPVSLQTGPTPLALDGNRAREMARNDYYAEAFFSLQLEKTPIRDKMLNNYLQKNPNYIRMAPLELDKIKRENIAYFIHVYLDRIANAALKAQIISCYNSIINLLKLVPDIAMTFFQFGANSKPNENVFEKHGNFDVDPRILRNRCRRVISDDGRLLNIWYIPHFTEILFLHRELDEGKANKVLHDLLRMVKSFHDLLHHVIGIWGIGFENVRVSDKLKAEVRNQRNVTQETNTFNIVHERHLDPMTTVNVFTDFEGSNKFQLKKEFIDLEIQIGNLKDPGDLEEVVKLLQIRKLFHNLYIEALVTSILPEHLLSSNREDVYNQLTSGVESTMLFRRSQTPLYIYQDMNVPSPIILSDVESRKLFPWRSLLDMHGPFVVNVNTWINVANSIQLCFAAISNEDRWLIKNQFYSFNLLLEEILMEHGDNNERKPNTVSNQENYLLSTRFSKEKKEVIAPVYEESDLSQSASGSRITIQQEPVAAYTVLNEHILAMKRFNLLKHQYYCDKLKTTKFSTSEQYSTNSELFRREILFPLLRKLCEELSLPRIYYAGLTNINIYPQGISLSLVNQKLTETLIENIQKIRISEIQCKVMRQVDRVIKERNDEGNKTPLSNYKILKQTFLQPTLYVSFKKRMKARFFDADEVIDTNEDLEETGVRINVNKRDLNECLQFLSNSIQMIQKETYESFAMYFENVIKHQQQLLHVKDVIISDQREQLNKEEQSVLVQRQFLLAQEVADYIMEINFLRAQLQENLKMESTQVTNLRKEITMEFIFIVRNIYSLSFDQMTQMKISVDRFRCDVFQKIFDARSQAFDELKKVKEKSGSKITADDDLMWRNVVIIKHLNKSRQANCHVGMITARMKSLFNWIYTYEMNVNSKEIVHCENSAEKLKEIVPFVLQISLQKIKLIKSESKRLNETLITTRKDLSDLRAALNSEINLKTSKRKTEELKEIKSKEGINHKSIKINNMLEIIRDRNAKMSTMQKLFNEQLVNKETVALKSHKKVAILKKKVIRERDIKHEAFMKVDDLISQVYEFEAAFAVLQDEVKRKVPRESTLESLSKPRHQSAKPGHPTISLDYSPHNRGAAKLTYQAVVNQHCFPYTPCHYLPFRRDRNNFHKIRIDLKQSLRDGLDERERPIILPKLRKSASAKKSTM